MCSKIIQGEELCARVIFVPHILCIIPGILYICVVWYMELHF